MRTPPAPPPGAGNWVKEDASMRREQTVADRITSSSIWRSVVRHGYPDTQRNQALIIASNVFLHIHRSRSSGTPRR
jgi:hypothetical protein